MLAILMRCTMRWPSRQPQVSKASDCCGVKWHQLMLKVVAVVTIGPGNAGCSILHILY
jgi:hypothetical protein